MTVMVHFLRNCEIITKIFFFRISTKREWCEEDSLPSFVAVLSTRNQSVFKDSVEEQTLPVINILFPFVKNHKKIPSTLDQLEFRLSVLELLGSNPTVEPTSSAPPNVFFAPWSKPLHDGFGAAAVRPGLNFERSCSLVFQQVFHVQRFNATFRNRLGL